MDTVADFLQKLDLLTVLKWWVCWQFFDFFVSRLKVRLRKPWLVRAES